MFDSFDVDKHDVEPIFIDETDRVSQVTSNNDIHYLSIGFLVRWPYSR